MEVYLYAKNQLHNSNNYGIKNPAICLVENVLQYIMRTKFFPDIPFSQNNIQDHGVSFKAEKTSIDKTFLAKIKKTLFLGYF